jgi:hypothetical protein
MTIRENACRLLKQEVDQGQVRRKGHGVEPPKFLFNELTMEVGNCAFKAL